MKETIDALRPSRDAVFTQDVQFFMAVRAGDVAQVRTLLARSPRLVDAKQQWDASLARDGVMPFANQATALITAIERNDLAMTQLLLEAGASVDDACGCATGESPVWTAVVFNAAAHLHLLIAHGANPNTVAATGNMPLHVAAMRGYLDLADMLLRHGADASALDATQRTPADWALANGHRRLFDRLCSTVISTPSGSTPAATALSGDAHLASAVLHTGIRALDLFAPLPRGGLVRIPFRAGVGMAVLLAELAARVARRADGAILMTGIAQLPLDAQDWEAGFAELGVSAHVRQRLGTSTDSLDRRREVFARALDEAEALRADGREVLLILITQSGFEGDVEASLPRLAAPRSGAQITTLVVTPLLALADERFTAVERPYRAQIAIDKQRALRRLFPAIHPSWSTSAALTPECVGERHVRLAARTRALLEWYERANPTLVADAPFTCADDAAQAERAKKLQALLCQRFFTAEPFTGHPGESTEWVALLDDVEGILGSLSEP